MTSGHRARAAVRIGLLALGAAIAGLGVVSARAVIGGEAALARAEAAFDRGDLRECVAQARRAASFAVPGAPHVDSAYRRLIVVAQGAEASGRADLARLAWEAVRAAALSTDHPWSGPRPELERANRSLSRLASTELAAPDSVRERELLRRLSTSTRPARVWLVTLVAGFFLAAGGVAFAGMRGFGAGGEPLRRKLWLGLAVFAIGAACWTLAVYQA